MRRPLEFVSGILLLAVAPAVFAQPATGVPEVMEARQREQGQALARELRSVRPVEKLERTGTITIRAGRRQAGIEVPFRFEVVPEEACWKTIYTTGAGAHGGPERLMIIHRPGLPNEYWFAQAERGGEFPEMKRLTPAEADRPLAGCDFWLTDLGLDFLHWPDQRQFPMERRLGRPSDVLESRHSEPRQILRIRSWVDRETGGILVAEGYDRANRLVKEFSLAGSDLRKVGGVWHVERMRISSPRAGTETTLRFDLPGE